MAINKRELGKMKEKQAIDLLKMNGYLLLTTNYYTKFGEIDIVAMDGQTLVFVEVKYRSNERFGLPEEAVDVRKRFRICQSARVYIMKQGISEYTPCRFDVVIIIGNQAKIIKDAFSFGE